MALEDFSRIFAELRRKLFYIAVVFGAGTIFSFPFMGEIIKKIEYDMFYRLNLPGNIDSSGRLADISHNLSLISRDIASNNSAIAQNLTEISGELLNISQSLNTYKSSIVYLTPLEVLMLEFKMSLFFGAIIVFPLIIYYAYKGFRGRMPKIISLNKFSIILIVLASAVLFLLGASYAYFYMLPFFLSYIYQDAMNLGVNATFSVYEFIYFVVMTTAILGFAFELPLVLILLVRLGITSRKTLSYYRRHAYVLLLIIAAWVTPDPTMFSQIMVMLPFVVLYEVSLLVMKVMGK